MAAICCFSIHIFQSDTSIRIFVLVFTNSSPIIIICIDTVILGGASGQRLQVFRQHAMSHADRFANAALLRSSAGDVTVAAVAVCVRKNLYPLASELAASAGFFVHAWLIANAQSVAMFVELLS